MHVHAVFIILFHHLSYYKELVSCTSIWAKSAWILSNNLFGEIPRELGQTQTKGANKLHVHNSDVNLIDETKQKTENDEMKFVVT
jgi:hypothetical protein